MIKCIKCIKGNNSDKNQNFEKQKNAFREKLLLTYQSKFQICRSNSVGCSLRTNKQTEKCLKQRQFLKFRKTKKCVFPHVPRTTETKKIRFLAQKMCPLARGQTNKHTNRHESDYRGHPIGSQDSVPSNYD